VPTHLDPSLILTNAGTSNAIRGMARVVTLTTGNVWNGVTTAGVTASFDAELAEVSDDTPSVARVSIPVFKAQAFVQADVEAFEDIDGLAADVVMLLADARDRLEGGAHATGNGTSAPRGIVTALDANTNDEIVATTAETFSLADLQKVYRNVPVRFRSRSRWLMNPLYLGSIQALGTALGASFSTQLSDAYTSQILGKPVVESDDMPNTVTTTANDNQLILGDFTNYVVVDKPGGMSVQFVPVLFNTANNLPDGRSGWYAHWRTGANSVLDTAFRIYQSKTSA
jgi:HK97 family phage major capsid protein